MYTDGSKDTQTDATGSAIIIPSRNFEYSSIVYQLHQCIDYLVR